MEKSCSAMASGRGGEQQKPASGKKKMEPRAPETKPNVLGLSYFFFFKLKHPKTTSFWGSFFFFKIRTPQNDVVFRCLIFFFF